MDLRIADIGGNESPRGTRSEIALSGPQVMMGYWNRLEATAAVIRKVS